MAKPLSKYMGGKQKLAFHIISAMPPHERYIEGFAGMASVYLAKPKAPVNIVNDFNSSIITLFEVARDYPEQLAHLIQLSPYASKVYEEWFDLYVNRPDEFNKLSKLKRALIFYYILHNAYNSQYVSHKNLNTFSYQTAQSWGSKALIDNLLAFSRWTQGTVFTCMDYRELLRKYAVRNTVVYLDPPYTMAGDRSYYEKNFTEKDHVELAEIVLKTAKDTGANFLISYDDHPDIRTIFSQDGFRMNVIEGVSQASSNADENDSKEVKNELVITTYDPHQTGMFGYA